VAISRRDNDPDRAGGLPVGRAAAGRKGGDGRTSRPARRGAWSSALPLIILALVVGLGGGVAIGWFAGHGSREAAPTTTAVTTTTGAASTTADGTGAYGVVTVSGPALPTFTSGQADAALGLAVPRIDGVDFEGRPQAISANGKGKLIVALAHWCPYCQQELPILSEWYASADLPDDIEVFLLSVFASPERGNFPPGPWLTGEAWGGPILADDPAGSMANALGIASVPHNLLVAPDGTVAARITGGLSVEQLDGAIDYLAAWEPPTTTP
jgi:thiol-disulfide isomerase/thioredoxin